jgi:hypothetical protein
VVQYPEAKLHVVLVGVSIHIFIHDPNTIDETLEVMPKSIDRYFETEGKHYILAGRNSLSDFRTNSDFHERKNNMNKAININKVSQFIPLIVKECKDLVMKVWA